MGRGRTSAGQRWRWWLRFRSSRGLPGLSALPWAVVIGIAAFALCAGGLGGTTSRRLAPVLATAFGLAHGAGFAGALLELDIPRERLLNALLGFNLGVEAAQLLALAVIAAVAIACRRLPTAVQARTMDYVSVALFALGCLLVRGAIALAGLTSQSQARCADPLASRRSDLKSPRADSILSPGQALTGRHALDCRVRSGWTGRSKGFRGCVHPAREQAPTWPDCCRFSFLPASPSS